MTFAVTSATAGSLMPPTTVPLTSIQTVAQVIYDSGNDYCIDLQDILSQCKFCVQVKNLTMPTTLTPNLDICGRVYATCSGIPVAEYNLSCLHIGSCQNLIAPSVPSNPSTPAIVTQTPTQTLRPSPIIPSSSAPQSTPTEILQPPAASFLESYKKLIIVIGCSILGTILFGVLVYIIKRMRSRRKQANATQRAYSKLDKGGEMSDINNSFFDEYAVDDEL